MAEQQCRALNFGEAELKIKQQPNLNAESGLNIKINKNKQIY